jgi:hypothetical protein
LCHSSIRLRAASHISSFDITSQRPSLARIRHSSSFARATIVTSGTGIIYGFRYRSPANRPTIHHSCVLGINQRYIIMYQHQFHLSIWCWGQ